MNALQHLHQFKQMYNQVHYPNVKYSPCFKYEDRTANGLTKCILDYFKFLGHYATRIQSQSQYRLTYGTIEKGTVDIHAVIHGRHCSIEVKAGEDRMSSHQKIKQAIEQAGFT